MTTENQEVKGEQSSATQQTEGNDKKEPQYTPIQLKAIEQGWIPREEFDGDEADFIDAPEFVRRGELFSKISSQSQRIKQVEQALDALREHNSRIKEAEYQRALKSLKQAKRSAQVNGETEQVFELEDKIEEVEDEYKAIKQEQTKPPVPQGPTPEFAAWVEQNKWYETDEVMQGAADALGRKLKQQGMDNETILKEVSKRIREEFPQKFNRAPRRASPVEGSSRSSGRSGNDDVPMSDWERDMMKKIVAVGGISEAEYKAQLRTIKERG